MKASRVLLSSIAATSAMTAFSYLCSRPKKANYREPELLAEMLKSLAGQASEPAGWLIHYSIGALWSPLEWFWLKTRHKANIKDAAAFGVFGGTTGAFIWELMFRLTRASHATHKAGFYTQLVVAHVVYSVSLWLLIGKSFRLPADQKPIFLPAQSHAGGKL